MKRTEIQLMADIYGEIISIQKVIKDIDYELFITDETKLKAVKYSLLIIGEASNKLSDDTRTKYNQVRWVDIISLRNRIIHDYSGIRVRLLWNIITVELDRLKELVITMIRIEYPEDAESVFKYYEQQ